MGENTRRPGAATKARLVDSVAFAAIKAINLTPASGYTTTPYVLSVRIVCILLDKVIERKEKRDARERGSRRRTEFLLEKLR